MSPVKMYGDYQAQETKEEAASVSFDSTPTTPGNPKLGAAGQFNTTEQAELN